MACSEATPSKPVPDGKSHPGQHDTSFYSAEAEPVPEGSSDSMTAPTQSGEAMGSSSQDPDAPMLCLSPRPDDAPAGTRETLQCLQRGTAALVGPLSKLGGFSLGLTLLKKRIDRFFVLDPPQLRYYVSYDSARRGLNEPAQERAKGVFLLDRASLREETDESSGENYMVLELHDGRVEHLYPAGVEQRVAASSPSFATWRYQLEQAIQLLNDTRE